MIDTNSIPQIEQSAQAARAAITSWNVVFALAGGIAIHAYHTIAGGGGVRGIARNFWYGRKSKPDQPQPETK